MGAPLQNLHRDAWLGCNMAALNHGGGQVGGQVDMDRSFRPFIMFANAQARSLSVVHVVCFCTVALLYMTTFTLPTIPCFHT